MIEAAPTNEPLHTLPETPMTRWLIGLWLSLGICFVAAEVIGLNGIIQSFVGEAVLWIFIFSQLLICGILITALVLFLPQVRCFPPWKLLVMGVCAGIVGGIVAVSATPIIAGNGLKSWLYTLRNPLQLIAASVVSMGWIYGGAGLLINRSLQKRKYRYIFLFLLVCGGIRILGLAVRWFQMGGPFLKP